MKNLYVLGTIPPPPILVVNLGRNSKWRTQVILKILKSEEEFWYEKWTTDLYLFLVKNFSSGIDVLHP